MSSIVLQYSVPASIILCGEYFITQPDHSAICMAVDRYAHVTIRIESSRATRHSYTLVPQHIAHYDTHIESIYENTTQEWASLYACPLLSHAYSLYDHYLTRYQSCSVPLSSEEWITDIGRVHAVFDTRAFFGANVQNTPHDCDPASSYTKLGFGSSEAMAVLSCVFLLVLSNINPLSCITVLAEHARNTHTQWQHNRGSGYGVYTSVFGGIGRYTMTAHPSWHSLSMPEKIQWFFLKEQAHISSPHAVGIFQEWCTHHPHEAKKLSMNMHAHVYRYPDTDKGERLVAWLQEAKALGIALGRAIGVSAEIPTRTAHVDWKAVGAGNECAVGCVVKGVSDMSAIASIPNIVPIGIGEGLQCTSR